MEIDQVYREVAPKLRSYLTGSGCSYATACDKASLGRMPVELLETFALSRLGKLTTRDIASGTGASAAASPPL